MTEPDFSNWEDEMAEEWNVVPLATEVFNGVAMNLMSLPTDNVAKMFGPKHGPAMMVAAIKLLSSSIIDKKDREKFDALSFGESLEVVSLWQTLSTSMEEQKANKRLKRKIAAKTDELESIKATLIELGLPEDIIDGFQLETDGDDIEEEEDGSS